MNYTANRQNINILLVGLSGAGKTSLCQAFGTHFVDGFSYGIGLSKKTKIVEVSTDQNAYHIMDAPGFYDALDPRVTQRHVAEVSKALNVASSPFVVCFVIHIQQHDMRVKQADLIMMRTIKQYVDSKVKFSLIINRLTEREFAVFADDSRHRHDFLQLLKNQVGITFTDDDILLIHDKFLIQPVQAQRELLESYVKKFETGHQSEFEQTMRNIHQKDGLLHDNFMSGYNAMQQSNLFGPSQHTLQYIQQIQQESQKKQMEMFQQIMGSSNPLFAAAAASPSASPLPHMSGFGTTPQSNPFAQGFSFQDQINASTSATNNYLNQYLNANGNTGLPFQQQSPTNSHSNLFNAAGSFASGAMGGQDNMYNAAGQFVGGAVTAGCTIM